MRRVVLMISFGIFCTLTQSMNKLITIRVWHKIGKDLSKVTTLKLNAQKDVTVPMPCYTRWFPSTGSIDEIEVKQSLQDIEFIDIDEQGKVTFGKEDWPKNYFE